jgi:hypothetical protein
LDVVDQQHVVGAVPLLEALDPLVPQRVDEIVHERLARHVANTQRRAVQPDVVRDRVQQMRLAEARVPVDEKRVVRLGGRLGDREGGRVGEPVRRADHERVEGVLGVDRRGVGTRRHRGLDGRRCFGLDRHDDELKLPVAAGGVADDGADQVGEAALDPLAGEVVRDGEDEGLPVETDCADFAEPVSVGLLVE